MNNSTSYFTQTSLRFTRWSRVGYAVFQSLSSAVSIGSLAVSISNCSLKNSIQIISNNNLNEERDDDDTSNEHATNTEISELILLSNNISFHKLDCVAQLYFFYYTTNRLK